MTPAFMPVGTRGAVKAVTSEEVAAIGYRLILANTFHLHLRPGEEVIARLGGLRRFMNWPYALLTDSGGYQVFSLAELRGVDADGVEFRSPYDGALCRLTPESAVAIQHRLGADLIMAFDECLEYGADRRRTEASTERTLRWLARCEAEHKRLLARGDRPDAPRLFGVVQGGFEADLRRLASERTAAFDLPGYAIGGLSVGEPEPLMMEMLEASVSRLPEDRPRYAMGVGLPLNLIDLVMRGVDLFDCVVPTRNGRNGLAYTFQGTVTLKHAALREAAEPLEADCPCPACRSYSRAYLRHLFMNREISAGRLATVHNLTFFARLMERLRRAIPQGGLQRLRDQLEPFYAGGAVAEA